MSLKGKYSTEIVEVIDENTQKYSSTDVSSAHVPGARDMITSKVTNHSDQSLWVRKLDTGKELKLSFTAFNVDARPGHRLMLVRNDETELLERIVNLNTDEMSDAYSTYRSRPGARFLSPASWAFSMLVFSLFPLANFLMGPLKLLQALSKDKAYYRESKYGGRLAELVACVTGVWGAFLYVLLIGGHRSLSPSIVLTTLFTSIGLIFFANYIAARAQENDMAEATAAMDQWVKGRARAHEVQSEGSKHAGEAIAEV